MRGMRWKVEGGISGYTKNRKRFYSGVHCSDQLYCQVGVRSVVICANEMPCSIPVVH